MIVTPSGHLPSDLDKPSGSNREGPLAEESAMETIELRALSYFTKNNFKGLKCIE